MKNVFMIIILFISSTSCKEKQKSKVYNLDNKVISEKLKPLKLDDRYANLLNPQISGDEFQVIYKSWGEFHTSIGAFVNKENFNWGVADSTITLVNKIYFDKTGKVDYFLFKVRNENVTNTKKEAYQKLLNKFIKNMRVNLKRDSQFAQCGKVEYKNY